MNDNSIDINQIKTDPEYWGLVAPKNALAFVISSENNDGFPGHYFFAESIKILKGKVKGLATDGADFNCFTKYWDFYLKPGAFNNNPAKNQTVSEIPPGWAGGKNEEKRRRESQLEMLNSLYVSVVEAGGHPDLIQLDMTLNDIVEKLGPNGIRFTREK